MGSTGNGQRTAAGGWLAVALLCLASCTPPAPHSAAVAATDKTPFPRREAACAGLALGECPPESTLLRDDSETVCLLHDGVTEHGPYEVRHPSGSVKAAGCYWNGERTGAWVAYYGSGQVRMRGYYEDGKAGGEWAYFRSDGQAVVPLHACIVDEASGRALRDVGVIAISVANPHMDDIRIPIPHTGSNGLAWQGLRPIGDYWLIVSGPLKLSRLVTIEPGTVSTVVRWHVRARVGEDKLGRRADCVPSFDPFVQFASQ